MEASLSHGQLILDLGVDHNGEDQTTEDFAGALVAHQDSCVEGQWDLADPWDQEVQWAREDLWDQVDSLVDLE